MKKVLFSLATVGIVSAFAIGASRAFFSDTETSANNSFQAGSIDLLINGENDPEGIVNFNDLKPGDEYDVNKELTVQNDAHIWVHLIDFLSSQGFSTNPEEVEENGVPKHDIENYLGYDLSVGDTIIIPADDNTPFPDVFSCWIPLGEFSAGTTTVTQSFHFDENVTNWAQGDDLTFSEEFYAVQSRNNPNPEPPVSLSARIWDEQTLSCIDAPADEEIFVLSTQSTPTSSTLALEDGKDYLIKMEGTYTFWPSCPADGDSEYPPCIADAEYSLRPSSSYGPGWVKGEGDFPSVYGLDLLIDGSNVEWGVFDSEHEYSTVITGDGSTIDLLIWDDVYTDNSGGLTVKIYELP